jgi:coproporphyrinogen III oxidase
MLRLQTDIVAALEGVDGARFRRDDWQREGGGGGLSMALEDGDVLERAGVLFSHVTGNELPASATAHPPPGCSNG